MPVIHTSSKCYQIVSFIGFRLHQLSLSFDRKKFADEVEIIILAFGVTKPPCFLNGGILFCNDSASNSASTDILILKLKEKNFKSLRCLLSTLELLKVAFIKKVRMHLSFPQTEKPYYFPEIEFWIWDILKDSNQIK